MSIERDKQKGISSYLIKTLLNGVTNTLAPGGKLIKESQQTKEQEKQAKKLARKEKRNHKK